LDFALQSYYANYFQCGSNDSEVIIDFGQLFEGEDRPLYNVRIITSRRYAMELIDVLRENLAATSTPRE